MLVMVQRLCLSPWISYSDATYGQFGNARLEFEHYLGAAINKPYKSERLILQMELLYKISEDYSIKGKNGTYDILVDEMSLLMNQFFSSTMDEYRRVNFETFVRLSQDTDQVIVMDALLHKVELDMIKILRSGEIKVTRYEDPNPTIWTCIKLEKAKEEDPDALCSRHLIINKLLELAREEKKVCAHSYSKGLIKAIGQAFWENNTTNFREYTADIDDWVKREELLNVNEYWKKYQIVLATTMVGAGIDFNQKHFDIAFSICGRSSTIEEQFQLLNRVRVLNENKIMSWIEREGQGKSRVPTKKQLIKEPHKRGCKMSPQLISAQDCLYRQATEREENQ